MVGDFVVNVGVWVVILLYIASWAIPYELARRVGWKWAAIALVAWTVFGFLVFRDPPAASMGEAIAAALGAFALPWAVSLGLGLLRKRRETGGLPRSTFTK